jgi:hypothetical protein
MEALTLPLAVWNGLPEEFVSALSFWARLDAFFVDNAPHRTDDPAVGLWCRHNCFDICRNGCDI